MRVITKEGASLARFFTSILYRSGILSYVEGDKSRSASWKEMNLPVDIGKTTQHPTKYESFGRKII